MVVSFLGNELFLVTVRPLFGIKDDVIPRNILSDINRTFNIFLAKVCLLKEKFYSRKNANYV